MKKSYRPVFERNTRLSTYRRSTQDAAGVVVRISGSYTARNNQRQRLSITSGKLNQLTNEQFDKIFEQAYYDNVTEVDISNNGLTELSVDLIISIHRLAKLND